MGVVVHAVVQADFCQLLHGDLPRLLLGDLFDNHQGLHHVLQSCFVAEEIVRLKDHGGLAADSQNVPLADALHVQGHIVQDQRSLVCPLQEIERAQEGGFAGAAGAQNNHNLARLHPTVHAAQNMVLSKTLVPVLYFNHTASSSAVMICASSIVRSYTFIRFSAYLTAKPSRMQMTQYVRAAQM